MLPKELPTQTKQPAAKAQKQTRRMTWLNSLPNAETQAKPQGHQEATETSRTSSLLSITTLSAKWYVNWRQEVLRILGKLKP